MFIADYQRLEYKSKFTSILVSGDTNKKQNPVFYSLLYVIKAKKRNF